MAQGYSNGGGGMSGGNSGPGGQPGMGGNTNGNTNGGNLDIQPMPEPQPNPQPNPQPQPAPRPPRGMGTAPQQTYIIYGTNQPYSGRVVEVGGQLYTTVGGALEGFSFQVMPRGGQNDPLPDPRPQPRPRPRPPFDGTGAPGLVPSPFTGNVFGDFGGGNTGGGGKLPGENNDFGTTDDGGIVIDDPMAPDPFADQGNMGG